MTDWAGYLQHFTEEGFSEEGIRILLGENPDSDSVLFVQETLEDAKKLIMMLDSVPKSLTESANGMKRRLLQHPSELEDIRARYNVMVVATTPWVASAEKMREQWSMEGRSIELAAWLRRLGSIDHNPPKETREVIQVIENIAPRDEVRRAIENLEGKQRERGVILQDMMNILERKGWNLEFSEHANLSQKFEEVSEWLELEDRIETLERKISQFEERRPNEANMGLKIIEKARLNGDRNAIKQLELDVNDEIQDILESDEEIKTRLNYWSQNGLIITDSEILTNNQLWKFEENLDELEKLDISDDSYETRIQNSIDQLKARSNEFLTIDKLDQYSPKFLEMYNNIVDKDGLHLIYSQFKTLEGIGIFKLVLEANGFAGFKIKKK